jgi:hypothetical protein
MSLQGKRVLVLQSEYLVALDLQVMLEKRGAVVSIEEPGSNGVGTFDAVIVDSTWASQPVAGRLFASGVHLIGYTGDVAAVEKIFPGCVVVSKPSPEDLLMMAVEHQFNPVDDASTPSTD